MKWTPYCFAQVSIQDHVKWFKAGLCKRLLWLQKHLVIKWKSLGLHVYQPISHELCACDWFVTCFCPFGGVGKWDICTVRLGRLETCCLVCHEVHWLWQVELLQQQVTTSVALKTNPRVISKQFEMLAMSTSKELFPVPKIPSQANEAIERERQLREQAWGFFGYLLYRLGWLSGLFRYSE